MKLWVCVIILQVGVDHLWHNAGHAAMQLHGTAGRIHLPASKKKFD